MKKNILIVGSEGLVGKALTYKLQEKYNCICIDIKKRRSKNYFFCDLLKKNQFKKILKLINKKNKIFAAINLLYPVKQKNFLQNDNQKFLKFINGHLLAYYNFNKQIYDLFSRTKQKLIVINFSSIYGAKIPNFKIYKGTNIKMPIEYSIAKSSLNIMSKYFDKWSSYKSKKIDYICISPAGIESNQSNKFKKNYFKNYGAEMINPTTLSKIVIKIFLNSEKFKGKNIFFTNKANI